MLSPAAFMASSKVSIASSYSGVPTFSSLLTKYEPSETDDSAPCYFARIGRGGDDGERSHEAR